MSEPAARATDSVSWNTFHGPNPDTYPPIGQLVQCQLRHFSSKKLGEALLVRVEDEDGFWRTADDQSEVSYDWDVVNWRLPELHLLEPAPITDGQRRRFGHNLAHLADVAARKGVHVPRADLEREYRAGRADFELGCWLYFYSRYIHHPAATQARIDCLRRLLAAGVTCLDRPLLLAFDIGPRQFDSLLLGDDAELVMAGVRAFIPDETTGNLAKAITWLGWPGGCA